jgi:hypothetical protein
MTFDTSQFKTGDLLLFHHEQDYDGCFNCVFSCFTGVIEFFSQSKYSHAAIIIRDPDFTDPPLKGLYVLESSFETFPDAEDHKYKLGVELEEFDKVISTAKPVETIYWRRLNCVRDENFYLTLKDIHKTIHDKPYDLFPPDWINALFHNKTNHGQNTNRFWCSALVAYAYVRWGFLPEKTQWTYVTPKMLGSEKPDKYQLKYSNCFIEKERRIL